MVKQVQSKEEFHDLLKSSGDKLVLVDFFAQWCGPCRMIAPRLEEFAKTYEGKLVVLKVDVDALEDLAMEHDISAMPTFKFFKHGKKVAEMTGADKNKLEELIKANL